MNKLIILFLLALSFEVRASTFNLKWNITNDLKLEARTMKAPSSVRSRVGEKGIYTSAVDLPIESELVNGQINVENEKEVYIYALFKNNETRTIFISVSPHSTTPGAQALGFKFSCLCNGHVYEIKPGEVWYKIMSIRTNQFKDKENVSLVHDVFEVSKTDKKNAKKDDKNSHHH